MCEIAQIAAAIFQTFSDEQGNDRRIIDNILGEYCMAINRQDLGKVLVDEAGF